MTFYHAFEILLVGTIVGACSFVVGRHFLPNVRAWLHPAPQAEAGDAQCGNGGCNGCSSGSKAS